MTLLEKLKNNITTSDEDDNDMALLMEILAMLDIEFTHEINDNNE